jgi:hypothetical protein
MGRGLYKTNSEGWSPVEPRSDEPTPARDHNRWGEVWRITLPRTPLNRNKSALTVAPSYSQVYFPPLALV